MAAKMAIEISPIQYRLKKVKKIMVKHSFKYLQSDCKKIINNNNNKKELSYISLLVLTAYIFCSVLHLLLFFLL